MSDAGSWYVAVNGQRLGEIHSTGAVIELIRSGKLSRGAYVYDAGAQTGGWVPISAIATFANAFQPTASPPPPPPTAPAPQLVDEIDYEVFGEELQFVEITLDPGEACIAEAGALMYMDADIEMETIFGDGTVKSQSAGWMDKLVSAGKRVLTGESLFMTAYGNRGNGRRKVAFAAPYPGKIIPVDLRQFGGTLICQRSSFLCAARGIAVGVAFQKKLGVGLFGGEGFILQKLEGNGIACVHAGGMIVPRDLQATETLRIDTGCLVALESTVGYDIQYVGNIKTALFGGEGLFFATLTGPGRVWLQSMPFSKLVGRILTEASRVWGKTDSGNVLGGLGLGG